jgi:hypothetical protein
MGNCPQCAKLKKFKCHCNNNFVYVECSKWNSSSKSEQDNLKSCKVPCTNQVRYLQSILFFYNK